MLSIYNIYPPHPRPLFYPFFLYRHLCLRVCVRLYARARVCVCWEVRWGGGCRNVPGDSPPAGTQLAIDGRTLRAVLEQAGRQAAVKPGLLLADSRRERMTV